MRKGPTQFSEPTHAISTTLEDLEVHFDIQLHKNRLSILHSWLEPILPHRLDGLLVQTHTNAAE